MRLDSLHVVVAGGATGGAGAALLLARAGARVTVLEKVAEPRAVGAGIAIAENGMAVLESLGLRPAIERVARQARGARVVDVHGRTLLAPPEPAPRMWTLRRATLQGILLDALAAEPRVECRFGTEVADARADGTVDARGEAGGERLRADLVIGADGVHSRVRECGAFGARQRPPGIAYVRTLVEPGCAQNVEAWTPAGLFGSFDVDDATYLFASAGTAACRDAVAARDLDAFRAAWARAYPPAAEMLARVATWDDFIVNRVLRVDCARWHDGRLVLLGDAAHAMAPNLGQGANSALVDAAVLLDELRRRPDLPAALAAYEARRRPAVKAVAGAAAALGAMAELTHPVARWMRDHLALPVARAMSSPKTIARVLQEPPATLLAIGRA